MKYLLVSPKPLNGHFAFKTELVDSVFIEHAKIFGNDGIDKHKDFYPMPIDLLKNVEANTIPANNHNWKHFCNRVMYSYYVASMNDTPRTAEHIRFITSEGFITCSERLSIAFKFTEPMNLDPTKYIAIPTTKLEGKSWVYNNFTEWQALTR